MPRITRSHAKPINQVQVAQRVLREFDEHIHWKEVPADLACMFDEFKDSVEHKDATLSTLQTAWEKIRSVVMMHWHPLDGDATKWTPGLRTDNKFKLKRPLPPADLREDEGVKLAAPVAAEEEQQAVEVINLLDESDDDDGAGDDDGDGEQEEVAEEDGDGEQEVDEEDVREVLRHVTVTGSHIDSLMTKYNEEIARYGFCS